MNLGTLPHFTRCGLPGINLIPYGIHACHFYRTRDELIAALRPYFIAGLEANERCLWITAAPLPAREAVHALRGAWDGADDAIHTGALRVLDFDRWYSATSGMKDLGVINLWLKEEERALADGYAGLRITGNTSFLTTESWPSFIEYENTVTPSFSGRRIVALCSYALPQCTDEQVKEVTRAHQCTFERADSDWQVIPRT